MRSFTAPSDLLSAHDGRGGELDLATLGRALWVRKLRTVLPTLLVIIAASVMVQLIAPRYKATASILLESQESSFTRPTGEQPAADRPTIDEQAVASQVQLLMSRDIARRVIQRLDLVRKPEFDPVADGVGPLTQALIVFGLADDIVGKTPEDRVLARYYEALAVYPIEKSRVIAVEFSSRDPDLAAQAANAVADAYIEAQRSIKRGDSASATDALSPQIGGLREKVAKAEAAVEAFRTQNGLFVSQNSASLSTQQLGEIAAQLSAARLQQADAEAKARLLSDLLKADRPIETTDVTSNDLIRRLVEQRANLKAQLALELRTLLPEHPRVKELEAQLGGLEGQIAGEGRRTVRSLENDALIAKARVEALSRQLDVQKLQLADANGQEVQLRALERDAKSQRDLLEAYLSRFREASARASFNEMPADARLVSQAVAPPAPYFPRKGPIILIAALVTFILTIALASAREVMSGRAYAPLQSSPFQASPSQSSPLQASPLEPAVDASAETARLRLAMMTGQRKTDPEAGSVLPDAGLDEAGGIDRLIGRLQVPTDTARMVLFAGASVSDASSEAASHCARALASSGLRVILIALGPAGTEAAFAGLGDLLVGDASFVDVIHRDRFSRLHLIPHGRSVEGSDPQTVCDRLEVVCNALGSTYDAVILDGGPVDHDTRETIWAPLVAGCELCVLVWRDEPGRRVEAAAEALATLGASETLILNSSAEAGRAAA